MVNSAVLVIRLLFKVSLGTSKAAREAEPYAHCNRRRFLLESAPLDVAELPALPPERLSYIDRTWKSLGPSEFFLKAL